MPVRTCKALFVVSLLGFIIRHERHLLISARIFKDTKGGIGSCFLILHKNCLVIKEVEVQNTFQSTVLVGLVMPMQDTLQRTAVAVKKVILHEDVLTLIGVTIV